MEEKEKITKKYNYSQYYNMGYTYEMVKEHSRFKKNFKLLKKEIEMNPENNFEKIEKFIKEEFKV